MQNSAWFHWTSLDRIEKSLTLFYCCEDGGDGKIPVGVGAVMNAGGEGVGWLSRPIKKGPLSEAITVLSPGKAKPCATEKVE